MCIKYFPDKLKKNIKFYESVKIITLFEIARS